MKSALLAVSIACLAHAQTGQQPVFKKIASRVDGRVGVCTQEPTAEPVCLNGDDRFSLQSVVKLIVAMALFDAADHSRLKLSEPQLVKKKNLSLGVQPIAELATEAGYKTTLEDLARRAIVDSDSAANDILMTRLGGALQVQAFLNRKGVKDIRVDRDERHLQTEIMGLTWKDAFVDPAILQKAVDQVPPAKRDAAYKAYQQDVRDTAAPKAMVTLLRMLADGKLLSPDSTKRLLDIMTQTVTFPDRLKAGTPPGWKLAHKTGTSGSWKGLTVATNDVGLLTGPDGRSIAIAAFIADSRAPNPARAIIFAKLAAAAAR